MTQEVRISRRQMLQIGGLGLTGISLPRLLRAESEGRSAGIAPRADAAILLFLNGGPSHLDMWDMKPDAPDGIRGEFKPIATSLSGVQFSEHLPRLALQAHRTTLIRSMQHGVNNSHAAAVYASLTGHDRGEMGGGAKPTDYPAIGSVLSMLRPPSKTTVPQVMLPYITKEGANGPPQPGFYGGLLGGAQDPMIVLKDPNQADFAVPELTLSTDVTSQRLSARRGLLSEVDRHFGTSAGRAGLDAMDGFQRRALELLTSENTQRALRIADEPAPVREAYGRNIYGQSVLLARRLIEAGTRCVTISWAPDANATWDTHGGNFEKLKTTLLPQFDAACSSLITDLADRGLLERTIVAVMGDFGRTPRINANKGGRDHWNFCYSLMFCGGGFKPGLVYGASDKIGAFPARDPLTPGDVVSTIYHLLGIQHDRLIHDQLGRPHRLVAKGAVVPRLIG
jgi:hypothetical protein